MYNKKYLGLSQGLRRKAVILCAISIALLFISSATAVPQVHGSIAIEKIDKAEKLETIYRLLSEEIDLNNLNSDEEKINSVFMLAAIVEQTIYMVKNPDGDFDVKAIQNAAEKISNDEICETDVISKTQTCLNSLYTVIGNMLTNKDLSEEEANTFETLKNYVSKLQTLVNEEAPDDDTALNSDGNGNDGFLQKLWSILMTILLIPLMILKGVFKGTIGLLGGLLKGIGSIVTIILLMLAGLQTSLILTGFFVIYIGILSKIGIKIFAAIGAPIFAILSASLTLAIGSVLGNISVVIHSILAVLIIFAIPLIIIAAVILLLGESEGGRGVDRDGLLYMMASYIAYLLGDN